MTDVIGLAGNAGRGTAVQAGKRSSTLNIAAAILGNALEFYDFTVYAAFAVMIGKAFFPSNDPNTSLLLSVATFGVGFFARPLGGIVIGAYADRYGRKPAMTLTLWLMALGSGLIGVLPGYAQIGIAAPLLLVLARLIQGFSAGGEMGPATTFLIECAPPKRRCLFGSWQLASQNMGTIISALIGVALAQLLPDTALDSWGWRVPFLFGILIAPVGLYIRSKLEETLDTTQAHESMGAVLSDLVGRHWRPVVLCILAISGATISQYFFNYATTYAITTLKMSTTVGMLVGLAIGVTGVIFSLLGGLLADRFGIKPLAIVPRILVTLLIYPALMLILETRSPPLFIAIMSGLMALHTLSGGAAIVLIPRCFPAPVRTAGLSIAYALGVTIFGGTAQLIFTWLKDYTQDPLSPLWWVVATSVLAIFATVAIRIAPDAEPKQGVAPR